jgi:hypothetical protein
MLAGGATNGSPAAAKRLRVDKVSGSAGRAGNDHEDEATCFRDYRFTMTIQQHYSLRAESVEMIFLRIDAGFGASGKAKLASDRLLRRRRQ